jgi:hypothetical protein
MYLIKRVFYKNVLEPGCKRIPPCYILIIPNREIPIGIPRGDSSKEIAPPHANISPFIRIL